MANPAGDGSDSARRRRSSQRVTVARNYTEDDYDNLSGDNSDDEEYDAEEAGEEDNADESERDYEFTNERPPLTVAQTEPGEVDLQYTYRPTLDSRRFTECSTESFQTNIGTMGNADHILQDAHNLYYSHMPRVLGTNFRFQVGEVAYAKWHGEFNVVVIHFVSQKLITVIGEFETSGCLCCAEEHEPSVPEPNVESTTQPTTKRKSRAAKGRRAAGEDGMAVDRLGSSDDTDITDDGDYEYEPESSAENETTSVSRVGAEPAAKQSANAPEHKFEEDVDNNLALFKDPWSTRLYAKVNEMQALPLRIDKDTPPDVLACGADPERPEKEVTRPTRTLKRYFMPMYFVSFPGYKKKCAKSFRFWVKEKDLIKFNRVRPSPGKYSRGHVVEQCETTNETDQAWEDREVQDINEYVYDVVYNVYNNKSNSKFKPPEHLPWCLPAALRRLVKCEHARILQAQKKDLNFYSIEIAEAFSAAPLKERLSAYAIVQNFKYILILMNTLVSKHGGRKTNSKSKADLVNAARTYGESEMVDEVDVPSLRFMEQLETSIGTDLNAQQFHEIYVNNIYWLDIYLDYMDNMYLHTHCYTEKEHEFLYMTSYTEDRPLSRILGLEHLARMFCYPVLYTALLKRITADGEPLQVYMPITQLLLHYLAFVSTDYMHSQKYMPSHLEGGLFKISHLKAS
ncbi:killing trait family protein, putative [Babesia ovata]|uniref:Killing trait family protein, putative n=1 Tax=Babesia ovata TaxID=189622 RepID=A0A2H6KA19_9APIC|nr:killing trait family protein, putative [Babesia ovata]GBE59836.1 killing trait family protein, putative [Babesia ovata]